MAVLSTLAGLALLVTALAYPISPLLRYRLRQLITTLICAAVVVLALTATYLHLAHHP